MTTGSFGRLTRLKLIFNTLIGERFVRRSLLREFIDLAAEAPGFEEVLGAATLLLRAAEAGIDSREFDRRLQSIGARLAILEKPALYSEGHPPSLPRSTLDGWTTLGPYQA
jgi:hypothetical protein